MHLTRTLLPVLACWLWCASLTAQVTDKGNFLVGTAIGFSTSTSNVKLSTGGSETTSNDATATQFNVNPKVGYFAGQDFALGISMDYTSNRVKEPNDVADPAAGLDRDFDSDLLFGPFARYYLNVGDEMYFFGELSFGFGSSVDELTIGGEEQTTSTNVFAASIGPGFTIISTSAIGVEALVKYNFARSSFDIDFGGNQQETITLTSQVDLSIGVQFYFTRMAPAAGSRTNDRPEPSGTNFY